VAVASVNSYTVRVRCEVLRDQGPNANLENAEEAAIATAGRAFGFDCPES
jgi:hypothetical protein